MGWKELKGLDGMKRIKGIGWDEKGLNMMKWIKRIEWHEKDKRDWMEWKGWIWLNGMNMIEWDEYDWMGWWTENNNLSECYKIVFVDRN